MAVTELYLHKTAPLITEITHKTQPMNFKKLEKKAAYDQNKKITEKLEGLEQLITELQKKMVPASTVDFINKEIDEINLFNGTERENLKLIRKKQAVMLQTLEKDLKLVTKNHYQNLWLVLGMSAFGLPIGAAIGLSLHNIGLLGIGLPIGMGIGLLVGSTLDKKAKAAGKQLDVVLKY